VTAKKAEFDQNPVRSAANEICELYGYSITSSARKTKDINSIPSLAVVFNLCDRRFDTRSGRATWHLMKK